MKRTMTGIPIKLCGRCGYEHPVTRKHCVECTAASIFVTQETGNLCYQCQQLPNQTDIFDQLKEVPR